MKSFGEIRKKQKRKHVCRHMTYTIYFVHCCICLKRAAHGEGFLMTSRTGKLCVTATTYSPSRTRTASACLIKSCKNWSSQKEKSMVAPIKRPCLLWIPKASAMQIPLRKRAMMRENLRNKAAYRSLCHGLLHAIYMTTANITDRSGAINMVEYGCNVKKSIPSPENSD